MKKTILIVEDEIEMVEVLKDNLEHEGYQVVYAYNGQEGIAKALEQKPDLIVLDILMPQKDGIEVCVYLRGQGMQMPILFLTAKGSEVDRVLGLEVGADDYLCKPFFMREFLARVKALLRRNKKEPETTIKIGNKTIDLDRFLVVDKKKSEQLSHYEVAILKLLWQHRNQPVSRNTILDSIWGIDAYPSNRTVDNYIVKLRKKLEPNHKNPKYIFTIHGFGYKLVL